MARQVTEHWRKDSDRCPCPGKPGLWCEYGNYSGRRTKRRNARLGEAPLRWCKTPYGAAHLRNSFFLSLTNVRVEVPPGTSGVDMPSGHQNNEKSGVSMWFAGLACSGKSTIAHLVE